MINGWKTFKIKKIGKIITGSTPSTNNLEYYGNEYMFCGPGDITSSKYVESTNKKLSYKGFNISRKIPANSILVTCIGSTIGKMAICKRELSTNQQINSIVVNKEFCNDFIYYIVKYGFKNKFLLSISNQAVPIINKSTFENLEITIPKDKREQEAIANVLSNVDNLIDCLEKTIEKKEKILNGCKKKFLYGNNWKIYSIEDIFKIGRGRVINYNEINSSSNNMYPVYSSQTTNNGIMGYIGTYDFEGEYITWTTDGANAGKVFYRNGKFNCTNVCGTLKLKDENKFDYKFIAYLLNYECKKYVSTNLANPKLMNNAMGKVKIKIPDKIEEQRNVANKLSDMDIEIDVLEQKLEKYKQIKKGMMEDLLTGKVRLSYEKSESVGNRNSRKDNT